MELSGKTVGILVEEIYNDHEFWYPYYRLQEAGATVLVIGPEAGATYKGKFGIPAKSGRAARDLAASDLDGLVIPGGYAPDRMRRNPDMVALVKGCVEEGKIVAAICHAGWMLASAKVCPGRTLTSFDAIKDDLEHAGATWVDEEVVKDKNLITSRTPDDLPAFMRTILAALV